eukprot:SAG22_NODE_639_length_8255_cov_13.659882_1_plen_57_part_10
MILQTTQIRHVIYLKRCNITSQLVIFKRGRMEGIEPQHGPSLGVENSCCFPKNGTQC